MATAPGAAGPGPRSHLAENKAGTSPELCSPHIKHMGEGGRTWAGACVRDRKGHREPSAHPALWSAKPRAGPPRRLGGWHWAMAQGVSGLREALTSPAFLPTGPCESARVTSAIPATENHHRYHLWPQDQQQHQAKLHLSCGPASMHMPSHRAQETPDRSTPQHGPHGRRPGMGLHGGDPRMGPCGCPGMGPVSWGS